MRHGEAAERAPVKRAFERDDEAAVRRVAGLHAVEQHRLDRILDRLGAGVAHEKAWRAGRSDAAECSLQSQRQHGLVFGVRIARGHKRQRLEYRADDSRLVFTKRLRGDQRSHVEKAVRLARMIAVDDGEVRANRLRRVERNWQRIEQPARGRTEGSMRRGKLLGDQLFELAFGVEQRFGNVYAHFAGTVPPVEVCRSREERLGASDRFPKEVHPLRIRKGGQPAHPCC